MTNEIERAYDSLLIIRYQSGDDCALDELIRRHEAAVRAGVVRWLGGNSSAVDDLCQEVWFAVIKGLTRLNQPMSWESWLGRITRTQVALFVRRRNRNTIPLDMICERENPVADIPETPIEWSQLSAAIQELGEPYVTMIRMRYWESYSYQQISESLQIPLGTVRSRLHWVRTQLANLLQYSER